VCKKDIPIIFPAIVFSILINTVLFLMLPFFWEKQAEKQDMERSIPVTVINFNSSNSALPHKMKSNHTGRHKNSQDISSANTGRSLESMELSIEKEMIQALQSQPLKKTIPTKKNSYMPPSAFRPDPPLSAGPSVAPPASDMGTEAHKGIYSAGEIDQPPVAIFRKGPFYPLRARLGNISGEVRVKFLVDTDGNVKHIIILKSRPKDVFDRSVINALSSWRFLPGKLHGKAVYTWVITTVKFKLNENR